MNLVVYRNNSEDNRIDKQLTELISMTGEFIESCSVLDPIITVELTADQVTEIVTANYIYIPEFKRYYFVKDWTYLANSIWKVYAHVDVLTTYAAQVRELSGVVKRQENLYNLYQDDGFFKVYQNPKILTKTFPAGFNKQSFILAVAGG